MAKEFSTCVEYGLKLSQRIYYGKESASSSAPVVVPAMSKFSAEGYLPSAPTVYAVVPEPEVVDNPDVPSYQPYVHGRCVPPALIPLQMHAVAMEIESYLDTAFVAVSGTWRVHCVMASRRCDCRIAVPMGEQGSLLGVEVDVNGRSYRTQLIRMEDVKDIEKMTKCEDGRFIKCQIYTLKVPQVDGGTTLSIKMSWSQKLIYLGGQFCLNVPFSFPAYVNPVGKKISKREKIFLKVNSGTGRELLCRSISHPLKELTREVSKVSFLYEAEVPVWSNADFTFSYTVNSSDIFGGVLLQSPFSRDFDQREMFCFYLFSVNIQSRKVFRKDIVFLIDISGSMRGDPLENTKNALVASLSKLNPQDSFNIIAFNGEIHLFSSTMKLATMEAVSNATDWVDINLVADGGTNILLPLNQAMKLLAETTDSIPLIFLITDGAVEDERKICNIMKGYLKSGDSICPRICTLGIGSYCNHYFLRMLAHIGMGHYDAAYDADTIYFLMQRLITSASSVILANVKMDTLEHVDSLEMFARRHIDILTARAWLSENKELEEKVAKMSVQSGVPCEYTCMVFVQDDAGKKAPELLWTQEANSKLKQQKQVEVEGLKMMILGKLGVGFGNLAATAGNIVPGTEEASSFDPAQLLMKTASNCCGQLLDRCCCMCFIKTCSYMNDRCAIVFTQLCAALACFECLDCCCELCECL
ncbi:hypothetical protein I3842_02G131900 [Carya illinoinensis]|uniref:VWFA domain-containing protein n=2 Tax=Carya illinoinensis TaxID=32201 RepID=A0A922K175_CARIL|nr:hypothetical protein I3842_02G131900 [Carya illinoinensis]